MEKLGFSAGDFYDEDTGFKSALYERDGSYALSFAGTDGLVWNDNKENVKQGLGARSSQYDTAIKLAVRVRQAVGRNNLVLTGHSLGGGLASAAAIVTRVNAVTFNAAGLHIQTVRNYGYTFKGANQRVKAYFTAGDQLSLMQDLPTGFTVFGRMPSAIGQRIRIGNKDDGHGISSVCRAMGTNC